MANPFDPLFTSTGEIGGHCRGPLETLLHKNFSWLENTENNVELKSFFSDSVRQNERLTMRSSSRFQSLIKSLYLSNSFSFTPHHALPPCAGSPR